MAQNQGFKPTRAEVRLVQRLAARCELHAAWREDRVSGGAWLAHDMCARRCAQDAQELAVAVAARAA